MQNKKVLYVTSAARAAYINMLTRRLRTLPKNSKPFLEVNDAINKFYVEELNAATAVANGQVVAD